MKHCKPTCCLASCCLLLCTPLKVMATAAVRSSAGPRRLLCNCLHPLWGFAHCRPQGSTWGPPSRSRVSLLALSQGKRQGCHSLHGLLATGACSMIVHRLPEVQSGPKCLQIAHSLGFVSPAVSDCVQSKGWTQQVNHHRENWLA